MSLADEIELQAVAVELLDEFGREVDLVPPGGLVDPSKPWLGPGPDGVPIPVTAVFSPARRELVPGTAVQIGDQVATIATRDLAEIPTTDWHIQDGAKRLAFVSFAEVKPGRSTFTFQAQVRASG